LREAQSSLVPRVLNKVQRECGDGDEDEDVRHGVRDHIDMDAERCRGFEGDSALEGYAKTADGAHGILFRATTRTHRCREFRGNAVARAVRAALPLHHPHVLLLKLSFTVHAHRCRCVLHWSPQVALCRGRPCGMLVDYGMREGGSPVLCRLMTAGLCAWAFLGEWDGMDSKRRRMRRSRSGRGAHELGRDRR
jgi:hypothetical protein